LALLVFQQRIFAVFDEQSEQVSADEDLLVVPFPR
jgi:hypothetical protein